MLNKCTVKRKGSKQYVFRLVLTMIMSMMLVFAPMAGASVVGQDEQAFASDNSSSLIDRAVADRRMVIIANSDYIGSDSDLPGTLYDSKNIKATMQSATFDGSTVAVSQFTNQGRTGILNAISSTFASADSSDISYFYYSGHGMEATGDMCGTDDTYISPSELKAALDNVSGTKVVIMDSCFSGNYAGSPGKESGVTPEKFNENFIKAFTDSSGKNFTGANYKIITASSSSQVSYEGSFPGSPDPSNGYFTYYFCKGLGGPPAGNGTMIADASGDDNVTLQEIYLYAYDGVNRQSDSAQNVQVYPLNENSFYIFSKTTGGGGDVAVTGVSVSPDTASIVKNGGRQLTATVAPSNATNKTVAWTSSNASVATVSSSGYVTGVNAGSAVITATTADGGFTDTCQVTVTNSGTNVAVTGVTLTPATASLEVDNGTQLTAAVAPSNATNKNVTWSTSNDNVAEVSDSGYVTGIAEGTATITVTTVDGGYTDTCVVTVSGGGETGEPYISIVTANGDEIADGDSLDLELKEKLKFTTTVYDENGDVVKKAKLKYSSSAKKVCAVAKGKLTAGKVEGTASITISDKTTGAVITFDVNVGDGGGDTGVVGNWNILEDSYYPGNYLLIFKADGSVEGDAEGSYTLSGSRITIILEGSLDEGSYVETLTGTVSGMSMSGTLVYDSGETGTWTASKLLTY